MVHADQCPPTPPALLPCSVLTCLKLGADGVDLVDDVFHAMDAIPGASIRLPGIGSKRERPGAAACPSYLR